jgi:hypothetical protein
LISELHVLLETVWASSDIAVKIQPWHVIHSPWQACKTLLLVCQLYSQFASYTSVLSIARSTSNHAIHRKCSNATSVLPRRDAACAVYAHSQPTERLRPRLLRPRTSIYQGKSRFTNLERSSRRCNGINLCRCSVSILRSRSTCFGSLTDSTQYPVWATCRIGLEVAERVHIRSYDRWSSETLA